MNSNLKKPLKDSEIIDLYFKRDERAISETDRKYSAFLLTIAFNILNDKHESEECKDDTYIKTWNSIPPEYPSVFRLFIAKIMRNSAIDLYRKKKSRSRIPSEFTLSMDELCEALSTGSPEDELEARQLSYFINEFLSGISKKKRYIFISRFYFSEPIKKIADVLRISDSAVYKEISSIKSLLRDFLLEKGVSL